MIKKSLAVILGLTLAGTALANGGSFISNTIGNGDLYAGISISRDLGDFEGQNASAFTFEDPLNPGLTLTFANANSFDLKSEGIDGNLYLGYGKKLYNKFYLGAEIFGDISNMSGEINSGTAMNGSATAIILGDPVTVTSSNVIASAFKFSQKWNFGLSATPGIYMTDSTLIYSRIGWVLSEFRLQGASVEAQSIDFPTVFDFLDQSSSRPPIGIEQSKTLNGLQLGLGIRQMLTRNIGVRAEWNWMRYQDFRAAVGNSSNGIAFEVQHPIVDQFNVGLDYHFNVA